MADLSVQASFNSGEWNPALFARVDLTKYRSGAALLSNWFVDYRGGASTRVGTRYVVQAKISSSPVRLIPFQATFSVGYILELGQQYMRFIFQGSPVLETGLAITGATQANPCVITVPGNAYNVGDDVFISGIVGMTQLNGRYFQVKAVAGNNVTLGDLNGNNINSTGYTAWSSGGTVGRLYTIPTPWAASDLALLKFAQQQNQMIMCHPNYNTQVLTLLGATNWTLSNLSVGATISSPGGGFGTSTAKVGSASYSYTVTSIDGSGQESVQSNVIGIFNIAQINTYPGSNKIQWAAQPGAVAYNIYESESSFFGVIPNGVQYGFIGTTKGTSFIDTNIAPDFSQTPPVAQNPFAGAGIAFITVTAPGSYSTVPSVTTSGGSPLVPATLQAELHVQGTPPITVAGTGFAVGDNVYFSNVLVVQVQAIGAGGSVTAITVLNPGSVTSGTTPTNPMAMISTSGTGTGLTISPSWGVGAVIIINAGVGYGSTPTINFSTGAATATATLQAASNGNPAVPAFFQQRLVLAAPNGAPQTFYMSQPGAYFNFNITDPVQSDNAITGTLVANTLNTIKAIVPSTAGMLILTDKASWIVNGGASGTAVTPTSIVANAQSWVGANDVPPIVSNYDVLYVQSKGSAVRDLTFNIYFNVFTGTDITIIASHLFYGYTIKEWCWAEQPFYLVWAVRSDGTMLTLTFLKDQEFLAWTHSTTGQQAGQGNGKFQSVATITEPTSTAGTIDAVYTVVQRTVNGNTVQYIERFAERSFPNGLASAWTVDCGLQYTGSATLAFQGAEQLAGLTVTGLAQDNLGNVTIITPFTMPVTGFFTLPAPGGGATGYTQVTIGLSYVCDLQTLPLDLGSGPTIQGKVKKIPNVDVRVKDTLGLQIGGSFSTLTNMKDLIQGNVSSMLTGQPIQVVNGLYTGDARTILDPSYTVPGQYCIRQPNPYPASVLGVIPEFSIGDG